MFCSVIVMTVGPPVCVCILVPYKYSIIIIIINGKDALRQRIYICLRLFKAVHDCRGKCLAGGNRGLKSKRRRLGKGPARGNTHQNAEFKEIARATEKTKHYN